MTQCRFVTTTKPAPSRNGDPGIAGSKEISHWCVEHRWTILHEIDEGYLCPIGRIEKATDEALARIDGEKRGYGE
jgi:hypothetical protein